MTVWIVVIFDGEEFGTVAHVCDSEEAATHAVAAFEKEQHPHGTRTAEVLGPFKVETINDRATADDGRGG